MGKYSDAANLIVGVYSMAASKKEANSHCRNTRAALTEFLGLER
jgi:hypothetical protein